MPRVSQRPSDDSLCLVKFVADEGYESKNDFWVVDDPKLIEQWSAFFATWAAFLREKPHDESAPRFIERAPRPGRSLLVFEQMPKAEQRKRGPMYFACPKCGSLPGVECFDGKKVRESHNSHLARYMAAQGR